MKKFSKILVLLFAVVAILTAFTMVASAQEAATTPSYVTKDLNMGWDDKEEGKFIGVETSRYGHIFASIGEDGNYYGVWQPKDGTGNNFIEPYFSFGTKADGTTKEDGTPTGNVVHKYNASEYPYMVLDFDSMTPTGTFGSPANFNIRTEQTKDSSKSTYIGFPVNFYSTSFSNYMSSVPYDWQHITVIMEFAPVLDEETGLTAEVYYNYYFYVDGKLVNNFKSVNMGASYSSGNLVGYLPEDIGFTSLRINGAGGKDENHQIAFDNVKVSFYPVGYGTSDETRFDEIVANVYNDDYEVPYGRTVAMIGDVKYEDIDDAIAAANAGDTIKLMCDQPETPTVNKCISFDRNDGEGGLYDITVKTFKKYKQSEENGILSITQVNSSTKEITGTWESKAAGDEIWVSAGRYGHIFVGESDNKENKYLIYEPYDGNSNNYIEPSLGMTLENQGTADDPDWNFVYNHRDYPYVAFDFDVMTPTGAYDTGVSFPFRTQHTQNNASTGTGTYLNFYATLDLSHFSASLDKTPHKWQHVTIIIQYDNSVESKMYYRYYVYINGADTPAYTGSKDVTSALGSYDPSDLGFTAIRMNGTDENPNGRQTAFDNFKISYFTPEFGTTADMADVVYTENYKFPYGRTVATVDGVGYDNLEEAIAAAKATDHKTLKLALDMADANVTADVLIDTNKYDENGDATGEFYSFTYVDGDYIKVSEDGGILTFAHKDTVSATVNWIINGEIYKTEKVLWGTSATAPEVIYELKDDLYRDIRYQWVNESGVADFTIAENTDVVNFTAALTVNGYTDYIAGVKDARLNFTYYAQLSVNFYLPVVEGMDAPTVSISNTMKIVYISGQKFWCYTNYGTTTSVFNDTLTTVTYTIDGVEYTQQYMVSGLIYAEIVLNDTTSTDLEKCAVANMVRFVRECLQVYGASNIPYDRINALIGSEDGTVEGIYKLDDYLSQDSYPDNTYDAAELDDYLESVKFTLRSTYASYIFTKTDLAIKKGVTFTVVNAKGVNIALRDPNTSAPWTLNLRVYDAIETITITAHIPAEVDPETGEIIAEATTLSAKYSMGSYIKATDNELMKAVYAFGTAARNYVENRKDY